MKLADVKPGQRVKLTGIGPCLPDVAVRSVVLRSGELCVRCSEGWHYLDGQEDEENEGELIGVTKP